MSKIEPYVLDDRVIIPDYIKKMSEAELDAAIRKLEAEIRKEQAAKKVSKNTDDTAKNTTNSE